jgi:uncharacterized protein YjiS (DUF1127 family)
MRSGHYIDTIQPSGYRPRRLRFGLPRLGHYIARGLDRLLLWAERSGQRHRLAELDDHMLRDIGLSRADVMAEATKPFWQP